MVMVRLHNVLLFFCFEASGSYDSQLLFIPLSHGQASNGFQGVRRSPSETERSGLSGIGNSVLELDGSWKAEVSTRGPWLCPRPFLHSSDPGTDTREPSCLVSTAHIYTVGTHSTYLQVFRTSRPIKRTLSQLSSPSSWASGSSHTTLDME